MKKLFLFVLLGLLLTGCGTKEGEVANEPDPEVEAEGSGIVAGEMEASLMEKNPLVFEYRVKNQTEEEVKLEFSSSQRFDYSVETKDGEEIFLFSSVASFLQVIGEENIKQAESLTYEIDIHDLNLDKGDYLLSAWMTPQEGKKYQTEIEFTVE